MFLMQLFYQFSKYKSQRIIKLFYSQHFVAYQAVSDRKNKTASMGIYIIPITKKQLLPLEI